jgi:LacI family transcriptional regulator
VTRPRPNTPGQAATINDVAARASVSKRTVTRVVNGEPHVSHAVRVRVVEAVAALSYRPDPAARRLASGRSHLLGLCYTPDMANEAAQLRAQMVAACRTAEYGLLAFPCGPEDAQETVELIHHLRIDGVVLTPRSSSEPALAEGLEYRGIPVVKIAWGLGGGARNTLTTDDRDIARRMTEYVIALGHRRIGLLLGPQDHSHMIERRLGCSDAFDACGLALPQRLCDEGDGTFDSGVAGARRMLSIPVWQRPTAIFAHTDEMAAGALAVAHQLRIEVPGGVSLAGFGDTPLATSVLPALTTIRLPLPELGRCAVQLLLKRVRSEPHALCEQVFGSSLIPRFSTAAVASSGRRRVAPRKAPSCWARSV